ncbi:peptidase M16 inactive domain-containing protein [Cryptosporidium andersoni]|uniref:Peptidase M16 inactive domain-containing protein n=1 Tax=Cryptosporidium andersoni TaxID=117008 RepID=A0A1J4MGE8_9CRYT|nr:peptidase M16 inactive domain-containing protein [Cryptosporidium andersoni]
MLMSAYLYIYTLPNLIYLRDSKDKTLENNEFMNNEESIDLKEVNSSRIEDKYFIKFYGDSSKYRFLTLKNNLKVYLISNKEFKTSEVSLGVYLENVSRLEHIPGLSYLLSQVIFIEYTSKSKFLTFLLKNNSKMNSFSRSKHTRFEFKINSGSLIISLEIFSSYLMKAKFTESSILNILNDTRYFIKVEDQVDFEVLQLLYNIIYDDINKKISQFPINDISRVNLMFAGTDVYIELLKFYYTYYKADLMTICITSDKDLDELEFHVDRIFSRIPSKINELSDNLLIGYPSLDPNEYSLTLNNYKYKIDYLIGKIIQLTPIKSKLNMLTLVFPIPNNLPDNQYSSLKLIVFLLTQSGQKKFSKKMKLKYNVLNIVAKFFYGRGENNYFILKVSLDSKSRILKIIESFFSTIEMIKSMKINDIDMKQIRSQRILNSIEYFRNREFRGLSAKVVYSSINNNIPQNHIMKYVLLTDMSQLYIKEVTKYISPENMILILTRSIINSIPINALLERGINQEYNEYFNNKLENLNMELNNHRYFRKLNDFIRYYIDDIPLDIILNLKNITEDYAKNLGIDLMNLNKIRYPVDLNIHTKYVAKQDYPESLYNILVSNLNNSSNVLIDKQHISKFSKTIYYLPGKPNELFLNIRVSLTIKYVPVDIIKNILETVNIYKLITISYIIQNIFIDCTNSLYKENIRYNNYKTLYDLSNIDFGITIHIKNYASIFPIIYKELCKSLLRIFNFIRECDLNTYKEKFELVIYNLKTIYNNDLASQNIFEFFNIETLDTKSLISEVRILRKYDILKFTKLLIKYGVLEGLIIGNCNPLQINSYLNDFWNFLHLNQNFNINLDRDINLYYQVFPKNNTITSRIQESLNMIYLPDSYKKCYYFIRSKSKTITNEFIFQIHSGHYKSNKSAFNKLIINLINKRAFTKIFKGQISLRLSIYLDILSSSLETFNIVVYSSFNTLVSILKFMNQFIQVIFSTNSPVISLKEFEKAKKRTVRLLESNRTTNELMDLYYPKIINNVYPLDWLQLEIVYLKNLTFEEFVKEWEEFINLPQFILAVHRDNSYKTKLDTISKLKPFEFRQLNSIDELLTNYNLNK